MNKPTISSKSQTDWERLNVTNDENIDLSDFPELTPEMFAKAVVKHGLKDKENKAQLTIRVDQDVLTWFKSQGRGYQTRINALLRAYMEADAKSQKSIWPPGPAVKSIGYDLPKHRFPGIDRRAGKGQGLYR